MEELVPENNKKNLTIVCNCMCTTTDHVQVDTVSCSPFILEYMGTIELLVGAHIILNQDDDYIVSQSQFGKLNQAWRMGLPRRQ